jgi:orotidine-5'-phosphate decarboxylase
LKLHDIPTTVTRATAQVARLGARYLTIHAYPQTMAAAKAGIGEGQNLKLLAVTVMTSYDDADLAAAGYAFGVKDLVARRAAQAAAAGVDGLILSAEEAAAMRASFGNKLVLVTPGIRPAGTDIADQKRIMTPKAAITAGADHLVVGRPILQAPDPKAAAEAVVAEIASAA